MKRFRARARRWGALGGWVCFRGRTQRVTLITDREGRSQRQAKAKAKKKKKKKKKRQTTYGSTLVGTEH